MCRVVQWIIEIFYNFILHQLGFKKFFHTFVCGFHSFGSSFILFDLFKLFTVEMNEISCKVHSTKWVKIIKCILFWIITAQMNEIWFVLLIVFKWFTVWISWKSPLYQVRKSIDIGRKCIMTFRFAVQMSEIWFHSGEWDFVKRPFVEWVNNSDPNDRWGEFIE